MSVFSEKLVELRAKKGMSQGALAVKAGLTRAAVSHLEADNREPTWGTGQRLALALGVDCRAFVDPGITLPDVELPRPVGRPRKEEPPAPPAPKRKQRKR